MANDTITLALDGDEIGLDEFVKSIRALSNMLRLLRDEAVGDDGLRWFIESLSTGSAIVTARCEGSSRSVSKLVRSYEKAGLNFRRERRTGFSPAIDREFRKIASLINGTIQSVRFETEAIDVQIDDDKPPVALEEQYEEESISTAQGRIETIRRHRGLRFTLYETHSDRPISCYLSPGCEEQMREAWGRIAIVEGVPRRDPKSGRITTMRRVSDVEVIPEVTPQECLDLIGAYKPTLDEMPEDTLERLRDGG